MTNMLNLDHMTKSDVTISLARVAENAAVAIGRLEGFRPDDKESAVDAIECAQANLEHAMKLIKDVSSTAS